MYQFGRPRKQKKKMTRNLKKKTHPQAIESGQKEEDTMRDVSSNWSTTDRQMSTLFSPNNSYQQLVEMKEEVLSSKDSIELLTTRKTVSFRSDNWRLEGLEEEVIHLRATVEEQARLLREARKQVDQLIVDYSNQKKSPLQKIVHHFESEPELGDKQLINDPKKHHTY